MPIYNPTVHSPYISSFSNNDNTSTEIAKHKYHFSQCKTSASQGDITTIFSAWVFLSCGLPKRFKRRFCEVSDKECHFYLSNESNLKAICGGKLSFIDRAHKINDGLQATFKSGQKLVFYVENHEHFEILFNCLSRAVSEKKFPVTRRYMSCDNYVDAMKINRNPPFLKSASLGTDMCSIVSDDLEGWMFMERKRMFGLSSSLARMYFKLSKGYLSYFSVNIEGISAKGGGLVKDSQYWPNRPNGLEVELQNGEIIRLLFKTQIDCQNWLEYFRKMPYK